MRTPAGYGSLFLGHFHHNRVGIALFRLLNGGGCELDKVISGGSGSGQGIHAGGGLIFNQFSGVIPGVFIGIGA